MTAAPLSEAAFTTRTIDYAKLRRWRCYHALPARSANGRHLTATQGHVGWPDLVAVRGRRLVVAELKVGRNKPTEQQTAWLEAFMAANIETYLWRPQDWDEIVEVLT